jgi:hypothetical protein
LLKTFFFEKELLKTKVTAINTVSEDYHAVFSASICMDGMPGRQEGKAGRYTAEESVTVRRRGGGGRLMGQLSVGVV